MLTALSLLFVAVSLAGCQTRVEAPQADNPGLSGGDSRPFDPSDRLAVLLAKMCAGCWADAGAVEGVGAAVTIASVFPPNPGGTQSQVTNAWSGGVLDTDNEQILIFGGGHTDYCGNEVYAFRFSDLQWHLLSRPSVCDKNNAGRYADGRPASIHSYNALTYIPGMGMFYWGGSRWNDGAGSNRSFFFNAATKSWNERAQPFPGSTIIAAAHYDASTGKVWVDNPDGHNCGFYSISDDAWTLSTNSLRFPDYHQTQRFEPETKVIWATGNKHTYTLTTPGCVLTPRVTTGDKACEDYQGPAFQGAPGFDWYPRTREFVCWPPGDRAVYRLDPAGLVWRKQLPASDNIVGPPGEESIAYGPANGLYGRWRWDAAHGCFIAVVGTAEHVFIYKPDF